MNPRHDKGASPLHKRRMSLARSTLVVGFATALSRVLGFARDMLIARALGAGAVADAFFIAFRLPNLARRTLSEGALNAGFVPLYLRLKNDAGTSAASRFAADALSGFAMLLFAVVGAVEIAAGAVVLLVAGGYAGEPHTLSLATIYTRLAFPFVWGISLASLIGAILNAERRFGAAAFAPVAVNVVLIATMLLLAATPAMPQETQARWLAFAVSVSGLVHLAIVAMALLRTPLRLALAWPRLTPELRRLLVMSAPAMLASGAAQFIILAATAVASYTPSAVSWLYYAERVFQLPLGFVGSAVGLVLLSDLADRLAAGDHDGLIAAHNRALEAALLMAMPAAVALLLLAEPIAQVLFERGAFGPHDTAGTAGALLGLAAGLPLAVAGKVLLQPLFARARVPRRAHRRGSRARRDGRGRKPPRRRPRRARDRARRGARLHRPCRSRAARTARPRAVAARCAPVRPADPRRRGEPPHGGGALRGTADLAAPRRRGAARAPPRRALPWRPCHLHRRGARVARRDARRSRGAQAARLRRLALHGCGFHNAAGQRSLS